MITTVAERIAIIVCALVLAALSGAWMMHGYMKPKLELAEQQVGIVSSQLDTQNKAVQALKDADDQRQAEANARVTEAEVKAKPNEVRAQKLLTAQVPQGVDACVAAQQLISQELAQ